MDGSIDSRQYTTLFTELLSGESMSVGPETAEDCKND
jgi:hypothetical protein